MLYPQVVTCKGRSGLDATVVKPKDKASFKKRCIMRNVDILHHSDDCNHFFFQNNNKKRETSKNLNTNLCFANQIPSDGESLVL